MTEPALVISELCVSYTDHPNVLKNINLEIFNGERVGLIGPNGAGKTTLFLSICGILKPDSGNISVIGKSVRYGSFSPEIGMVFQNPDDQLFCPSVRDDVAFGPQNMGLPKSEVSERVKKALVDVNCQQLTDRAPHHLSGGEKRMISIAGILAMRPRFIIYDEPSANLGMRSRRRVINLIRASTQTVLISSHDLELILETCERVILLDEGRIITDGIPHEIMNDTALMETHGQEKPHSLIPHPYDHHDKV